jgi:hypothetical protein
MAGEEDVELRDVVAQSLEAKGVLGKIRAQLRANVFLTLEEQESKEKPHPFVGERLRNFQKTKEGRQAVALVREFLEFFELDFTTAVFDPETNACESYPGRDQLARDLGLEHHSGADAPLLSNLLRHPHTHSPSHSFPFAPSLHSPSHHLPSHVAIFPTSLTAHHHTSSHPHITNGNSLPPLSSSISDSVLSRPHQASVATGELIPTSTSTVSMPTNITMVTSSTSMPTTGGELPQSTILSAQNREKVSLTSSSSQHATKLAWSAPASSGSDHRGTSGMGALMEVPTTMSAGQLLDDLIRTTPAPSLPALSQATRDEKYVVYIYNGPLFN